MVENPALSIYMMYVWTSELEMYFANKLQYINIEDHYYFLLRAFGLLFLLHTDDRSLT